jgi:hypothetical protein
MLSSVRKPGSYRFRGLIPHDARACLASAIRPKKLTIRLLHQRGQIHACDGRD